jgi:hypothetical protein
MKLSLCLITHNAKKTWGNGYIVGLFYMLTIYIIEIEICLVSIQQQNLTLVWIVVRICLAFYLLLLLRSVVILFVLLLCKVMQVILLLVMYCYPSKTLR